MFILGFWQTNVRLDALADQVQYEARIHDWERYMRLAAIDVQVTPGDSQRLVIALFV
jgi:hypothetical protein